MTASDTNDNSWFEKYYTYCAVLIITLAVIYSFNAQIPSADAYNSVEPTEFSQQNALTHLKEISSEPHYLGSETHPQVADYLQRELQKLGLNVEIFEQQATRFHRYYMAAKTKNIIAKIPGKVPGNAVALVSHYDSGTHSSLGASDAGSGVVTIVEGIRAFLAPINSQKMTLLLF